MSKSAWNAIWVLFVGTTGAANLFWNAGTVIAQTHQHQNKESESGPATPKPDAHSHSSQDKTKASQGTAAKPALKPAEDASIKIVSPKKDQVLIGDKVPLEFKLIKGKRGHHAHAYVDGELMGMFESEKGILNGIKPGKHTLELRVVTTDHNTELDATDKVTFTTK